MNHLPEVIVLGEALVDVVVRPGEKPVEHVGGSPAKVALGLGRRGIDVVLLTSLGQDDWGDPASAQRAERIGHGQNHKPSPGRSDNRRRTAQAA